MHCTPGDPLSCWLTKLLSLMVTPDDSINIHIRFILVSLTWAALLLAVQLLLATILQLLRTTGIHKRTHVAPVIPTLRMIAADVVGLLSQLAAIPAVHVYMHCSWSLETPNFILMGVWALAQTFLVDTWYYWIHRFFHSNKTVFSLFHAKHHSPKASLGIMSAFYVDPLGGLLEMGIPGAIGCYLTYKAFGNFWYLLASYWQLAAITICGHGAYDGRMKHPLDVVWYLTNPTYVLYALVPYNHTPLDHEQHHRQPRSNYAPFYSFWDERCGTRVDPQGKHCAPTTGPLIALAHLTYFLAVCGSILLLSYWPSYTLTAYILAYWVVKPKLAAAVVNALHVPELVRHYLGSLMDAYRVQNMVSFAQQGQPGSFTPVHESAAAENDTSARPKSYIFGCHPTGILSRGALLTFAVRGWKSPVSNLSRVRLAVSSKLLRLPIPFSRELLLACGCIPADKSTLAKHLTSGTSVAVAPGGWTEPTHTGSYDLLLKSRFGYVKLAMQTGATLVPVLCLGEHLVGAAPDLCGTFAFYTPFVNWVMIRLLNSNKPRDPVHVVFGEALDPRDSDSVKQLHARYVAALMQLAKQHSVALNVL